MSTSAPTPESTCASTNGGCGSSSLGQAHSGLIDRLIESQQQLTAVERFSQQHVDGLAKPALEPVYRDLIPLELPAEGEQYSFEVDLDSCSGCKACVTACHSLNGLEEGELWRNVGLLVGGGKENPILQHVTGACHHCLDPACMNGCPVGAYEKDATTGIVEHLDDQCIGCKYCMFMCPYDVPSYSHSKGIVRKCNMCSDRLAVGEAPACVQACPHQAIKIRKVSRDDIVDESEMDQLVPGAPEAHLTMPTTRYNTQRVMPRNLLPDDYYIAKPLHAHFPLVFMLVLTQMAAGIFAASLFANWTGQSAGLLQTPWLHGIGLGTLIAGLSVAILHLGRPMKAYRAMSGIRTSWLSREIFAFNLFAGAASVLVPVGLFPLGQWAGGMQTTLLVVTAASGAIAVASSAMLYVVTKRPLWTSGRTFGLFFLTAAILGAATASLYFNVVAQSADAHGAAAASAATTKLMQWLIFLVITKLLIEGSIFTHLRSVQFTPRRHAARLMTGDMKWPTMARYLLLVTGGIGLPLLFVAGGASGSAATVVLAGGLMLLLVAEVFERYLFFAVSVARRMPGAPN